MWRRRKRMELVRFADRRKYRSEERSHEEITLTRRMFVVKGLVVTGFAALAGKLWQMQMVESATYETRAEGNILDDEPVPAPRGLILDRTGQIVAENRVMWQIELIPAQLPDDEEDREYVRDQVVTTLELKDMLAVRPHAVPNELDADFAELISEETGVDKEEVRDRFDSARDDDNVIPLKEELEESEAESLRERARRVPGLTVMNEFDFVVESNPVAATPTVLARDVDREVALALEANKMYLPGIAINGDTLTRRYTAGPELSHILGYVGPITEEEYEEAEESSGENPYLRSDNVGRGGIEQAMESELRGRRGIRFIQTDARGVELNELEDRRIEPQPGRNLHLTIDRRFQAAVARALQEGIDIANDAALSEDRGEVGSGVVVAIDPRSGDVLAMVSLPNFDNQVFVDGISDEDYQALIDHPFTPLTNMAVSGTFPPGSTIKPLMACMGLEEETITRDTEYFCGGSIDVPTVGYESEHNTYVCWFREGHGSLSVEDALAESCNIFFYNVGAPNQTPEGADEALHYFDPGGSTPNYFEGLGIDLIEQYLKSEFRFGEPTGIELANESSGVVPSPQWLFQSQLREYWSVGDTINVSIGQGHLQCTPLQLTCALGSIANGGTWYRPRLVRGFDDGNPDEIDEVRPEVVHELGFRDDAIEIVRQGMRQTVTEGTAWDKFPRTGDDIPIAGKTGTADFGEAIDGSYSTHHASFCAFAPFDNPEIAVSVLIRGGGEGSTYAVPVADAVLAAYFGREPLEPEEDQPQDDAEDDADPEEEEPEDAEGDQDAPDDEDEIA